MAHILIIDDEPQIRMMLKMMLESEGYTVAEACDGNEGIQRHKETPADLIITDIIMPGKEGIETIIALRKNDPSIKIIAMSGGGRNNPEGYLKSAKLLGAEETFAKPVRKDILLAAVRRLI